MSVCIENGAGFDDCRNPKGGVGKHRTKWGKDRKGGQTEGEEALAKAALEEEEEEEGGEEKQQRKKARTNMHTITTQQQQQLLHDFVPCAPLVCCCEGAF